jgi:hypothetical protein
VLDDQEEYQPAHTDLQAAYGDLVIAIRDRDLQGADKALTHLATALGQGAGPPVDEIADCAVVECLRARVERETGRPGAARCSAAIAIALARCLEGEEANRILARVLINASRLACDLGDIDTARNRAREVLAIAQAAFGSVDPDTASAWAVLAHASQVAGDAVAANAAWRRAEAAGHCRASPLREDVLLSDGVWPRRSEQT